MNKKVRLALVILPLIFGLLLAFGVLAAMGSKVFLPLRGEFYGAGDNFSGQITHLGRFDGVFDPSTLTAVWVAANGDTLTNQTVSFEIGDCPAPDRCSYKQELVITGGSGRFTYAGGRATVTGMIDPAAGGAYDGRIEGKLTWQIPDDADLAARIAARQHLLDLNDDGYQEMFDYDIALLGENKGEAKGSVQWRNGNIVTNLAINSGMAKCDRDYKRPFLQLNSTATSWSAGNNGSVQEVQPNVAIRIRSINSSPVFESPLRWTIVTTDQPPIALSMLSAIGEGFDFSQPLNFTDTWPVQSVLNVDPCDSGPVVD